MRTISRKVTINASPDTAWTVLAELPRWSQWNPFTTRAAGQLAVGQRLTLRMAPAHGPAMTIKPTVLVAEPGRELRWTGRLLVPASSTANTPSC